MKVYYELLRYPKITSLKAFQTALRWQGEGGYLAYHSFLTESQILKQFQSEIIIISIKLFFYVWP